MVEHLLFADDMPTGPAIDERSTEGLARARVRARRPEDDVRDPPLAGGEWVAEVDGRSVGAGGIMTHYNPPFGDLYMEVDADARGRGIGSCIVRELRAIAKAQGLEPAARCSPENEASRRTLLRGGMRQCGSLLSAEIAPQYRDAVI